MTASKRQSALLAFAMSAAPLFFVRQRAHVSAADSETITWGASGPTWLPGGRQLAFSVFGSIWLVSAQSGEARQITTSGGYHAHPAWSPKGDLISFVSGSQPAGRIPNISGELRAVEPESGAERAIAAR